ncbi:phage head morphogenesis, SPP1 gp7 family domain protein [Clostridium argentinense CDC 2741]|uniref:Phage head morphogenesis, SPP1 gp7 family domain protein n=1 Tax=Clostridium argentinense CDC 2741 TaxID=1418104 RepID=A0A0C1U2Q6_9CLOT|nr:minor capsid protein [Clostridium argentinense]ARC85650.1 phage head morphogenesis protein [Clostridium argentinense]KIE47139.1 phage head morphogenesis, SPP1 gp7 family domain protein [Clostridium argentinense CDC 2741]NFF40827.1 hypothetical protein [Clostridium argentinense]NFP50759.1 hypothetical protein [Clostridium argentinense]NFP73084.1 hypothetical protein [Clostridium argentinense]
MNNKKISKDILKQFVYVLNIAEDKLNELLKGYDNTQEELEKLIYYAYKNYSIENTDEELNLYEIKKYDRIDKIDKSVSNITKELSNTEVLAITMLLKKTYNESFNRNIYVLENNLKINAGVAFMKIPKQVIQNVIEYPIEGLTFSERIWANQFKLKNNLKSCIVDGIVKGKNIRTLSKELQEKMDTGRDNCSRLLRDQVARVWDAGQQKAWEETGVVEQVIWISTLDGKTSDTCRNLDGEIFDLDDAPDCPAHVNCRSCKAPYFKSIIKTRFEQQNRKIIQYENYEEWTKDNTT